MTAPFQPAATVKLARPSGPTDTNALAWLDQKHEVWATQHEHWLREENRLYGGDPVLKDLVRFDWEADPGAVYASRRQQAHYVNLPMVHAALVTGHVGKKRPTPGNGLSFGSLGEVRTREDSGGSVPSRAEMLYYNVDGIGQDGKEWAAWWDGVYQRAEATGHRWVMVETPRVDPTLQEILTYKDELAGARPFLVEYSPLRVTNWWYHNGELQFAVIRPVVDEPFLDGQELYMPQLSKRGYYLLVRQGCDLLGPEYAVGGWWLWDSLRTAIDNGRWDRTAGRIPLFPVFAEADPGTDDHANISRSQTMEIGQCAVGIMNLMSARDYDAFNAAQSKTFILGCDPQTSTIVATNLKDSQLVAVPPIEQEGGTYLVPTIYDGSQGAVAEGVFKSLIAAKFDEAQRTMMEKATAADTSSGTKQVASYAEASSPLLVRRARFHQMAESTALYFTELRWGTTTAPSSYSIYPSEYDLAPLTDDIDDMFDTLRRAQPIKSASLWVDLIMQALDERGLLPKDVPRETIEAQLKDSLVQAQAAKDAQTAALAATGLSPLTAVGSDGKTALPGLPQPGGTPSTPSKPGKPDTPITTQPK